MTTARVAFTFSIETLADARRREFCRPPDQTLLALVRSVDASRLLIVDGYRSVLGEIYRGRDPRPSSAVSVMGAQVRHLKPLRIRRKDSTSIDRVRRSYARYVRWVHSELTRHAGEGDQVLVTYSPFVAAFAPEGLFDRVVFIARDDWASSPRERPWWPVLREAYRRIDERGALIFAVSAELANRLADRPVRVVPNGIDASRWARLTPAILPAALTRPVAVYAGTIDDRVDVDLVRKTRPGAGSVLLLGPVVAGEVGERLASTEGVHLWGNLGQDELARTLLACDVGLVCHRVTPLTTAMSPLKVYEYLAAGLPVAAVDLPPLRGLGERVVLDRPEAWSATVKSALAMGRATERERQSFLREADWSVRQVPIVQAALGGAEA